MQPLPEEPSPPPEALEAVPAAVALESGETAPALPPVEATPPELPASPPAAELPPAETGIALPTLPEQTPLAAPAATDTAGQGGKRARAPRPPRKKAAPDTPAEAEAAAPVAEAAPAATAAEPTGEPYAEPTGEPAGESKKKWYAIKVQSGREESIKAAIERRIKIEGLEPYFGQIVIPVEEIVVKKTVKVKDKKTGEPVTQEKKVIKKQKKYPGYLFAELEFNDRMLMLFRETGGVGDFVGVRGRREPTPLTDREIQQILSGVLLPGDKRKLAARQIVKLDFEKGDKVRIREGAFANMEGEVKAITDAKEEGETPKVTVVVTVFGRPVDVTVDYWQVDKV